MVTNVVLVSGVQLYIVSLNQVIQLYIYMYVFFIKFSSHLSYYRILNRVP